MRVRCDYANACVCHVVSRHGCSPAMAEFREELDYYLDSRLMTSHVLFL